MSSVSIIYGLSCGKPSVVFGRRCRGEIAAYFNLAMIVSPPTTRSPTLTKTSTSSGISKSVRELNLIKTEFFAEFQIIACFAPTNNPPGDDSGDLRADDRHFFAFDRQRISFVDRLASFARRRIFFALDVIDLRRLSGDRRAVDVNVERRQKNADEFAVFASRRASLVRRRRKR